MAVAVDWLNAYRAARINQIVGMYSPDAVIECACGGHMVIYGQEAIAAYWRHRFSEMPALELEDLAGGWRGSGCLLPCQQRDRRSLDISEDGLITRCRCGPTWVYAR